MKRTGEILRKAREEKDLSLHEIGLSLKINNKILKAIEDGDTSKLPAKTFLRGFVQSYANFLHLNTEEVLNVFYEEMGSTKPTPYKKEETINTPYVENTNSSPSAVVTEEGAKATLNSTEVSSQTTEEISKGPTPESKEKSASKDDKKSKKGTSNLDRNTSATTNTMQSAPSDIVKSSQAISSLDKKSNVKTYIGLIAIAALLAVIVFVKQMIDKYSKEAEVPSAEVAETIENATPILFDSNDTALTDIDQAPSPLSPNAVETEARVNAQATVTAPIAAPPQVAIKTDAISDVEKKSAEEKAKTETATASASVAATEPKKEEAKKPEPASVGKPVELIVEALDGVEIEYSAPNGTPQKIKLSSEQVHTFKSKSGLIITFSNGGVVNLILNGKEVGIPGDLGKPIKLSY